MSAIVRMLAVASLDMTLSPLSPLAVPSPSHVDHARLFGVLSPVVLRPGSLTVLSGHYQVSIARAAGLSSVPCVDAVGDLATDRPVDTALALDRIRSAGTDGARAALMARAVREEGATPQGIAERTSYSVKHVQNMLRTWDGLASVVRAAWHAGTLGTKVAIRLAALPHDAQVTDLDYLATTPEHAARVKVEREEERLRARLAVLAAKGDAVPAYGKPVATVATNAPHARALRSILESTLAGLPNATGKDAARMRGIVDALAFALGDVPSIPSLAYAEPVASEPVVSEPVASEPVAS